MSGTTTFHIPARPLSWLITGCSSGFGLSLTRIVIKAGHKVVASSRDPAKTPELVREVEQAGGKWVQLDIASTSDSLPAFIESLGRQGENIDVLVNNAGYSVFSPVEFTGEEDLRGMMETMFFGPIRLVKAVLPGMRKRKFGVIVNFSSGASLEGAESMSGYAGVKAALDGTTRVLAKEIAPFNIRTLTVILGTFNTSFNNGNSSRFTDTTTLPADYRGSTVEKFVNYIQSGQLKANGDKDKAMRALFGIVSGTQSGEGNGNGSENLLLMGKDMVARAQGAVDRYQHAIEVFGDLATSVALEN